MELAPIQIEGMTSQRTGVEFGFEADVVPLTFPGKLYIVTDEAL